MLGVHGLTKQDRGFYEDRGFHKKSFLKRNSGMALSSSSKQCIKRMKAFFGEIDVSVL
jgi:hypothetical protein